MSHRVGSRIVCENERSSGCCIVFANERSSGGADDRSTAQDDRSTGRRSSFRGDRGRGVASDSLATLLAAGGHASRICGRARISDALGRLGQPRHRAFVAAHAASTLHVASSAFRKASFWRAREGPRRDPARGGGHASAFFGRARSWHPLGRWRQPRNRASGAARAVQQVEGAAERRATRGPLRRRARNWSGLPDRSADPDCA